LSILLYGSEIWCLREDLFNRLRHFHHRCARIMCRITIAHTIRHRTSASLFKGLSIELFDEYYNRRLLRWTGHVARMPLTQAPRKILTSWVDNPRPLGCPQMNWGRTLKKALFGRGLVECSSCRGSGSHSTCFEAPRLSQDVNVNRKGDANPAHLPHLGSLLCTWIRAGHLGSCPGQPGSGTRLSQLGE
jgi:hypothetical protein